jgi:hypothetical protein
MKLASLAIVLLATRAVAGTISPDSIPCCGIPGPGTIVTGSGSINFSLSTTVNQSAYIAPGTSKAFLSSWDISALFEPYSERSFTITVSTTGNVYLGMIDLFSGSNYLGSNLIFPSGSFFSINLSIPVGIVSSLQLYTNVPEISLMDNKTTSGTIQTTVSVNGIRGIGNSSGTSYGNTNNVVGGVHQVGATPEPKALIMFLLGITSLCIYRIKK